MKKSTKSTTLTKKSAQDHPPHAADRGGVMSPELLETEAPPQARVLSWDKGARWLAWAREKRERARIVKTLSKLRGGRS